mgnify:CR=1 FL=1
MKKSLALLLLLLVVGCREKEPTTEAIQAIREMAREQIKKIDVRDDSFYLKGTDTPYSGKWYGTYEGQYLAIMTVKNGKPEGTTWFYRPNGVKAGEREFKDGKLVKGSENWWNSKGEPVDTQEEAEAWVSDPNVSNNVTIETVIRNSAEVNKPTGQLNKADLDKLKSLSLSNKNLTDATGLEKLTQLEELDLHGNKLTDATGLEKLSQLEDLVLSSNHLSDFPGNLEAIYCLSWLDLGTNEIPDMKGVGEHKDLTFLFLSKNKITDLKGLEKLKRLQVLDLSSNQITDVTSLETLYHLHDLDLSNNQLSDVTGLEKLTNLKKLNLAGNPDITKAQIDQLKKALRWCEITR